MEFKKKTSKLKSLSLNRQKRIFGRMDDSIEEIMPKTKDAGQIRIVKHVQSPSKQSLLTMYYSSPLKNNNSAIKHYNVNNYEGNRTPNVKAKQKLNFDKEEKEDLLKASLFDEQLSYDTILFEGFPKISGNNSCSLLSNSNQSKRDSTEVGNTPSSSKSPKKPQNQNCSTGKNNKILKKGNNKTPKSRIKRYKSLSLSKSQLSVLKKNYSSIKSPSYLSNQDKNSFTKNNDILVNDTFGVSSIKSEEKIILENSECGSIKITPLKNDTTAPLNGAMKNDTVTITLRKNTSLNGTIQDDSAIITPKSLTSCEGNSLNNSRALSENASSEKIYVSKDILCITPKKNISIIEIPANDDIVLKKTISEVSKLSRNSEVTITTSKDSVTGSFILNEVTVTPKKSLKVSQNIMIIGQTKSDINDRNSESPREHTSNALIINLQINNDPSSSNKSRVKRSLSESPGETENSTTKKNRSLQHSPSLKTNINSTPSKMLFNSGSVKLSPKIRRCPGKFISLDSLPPGLSIASPSKSPKKVKSPPKRNLINSFNQTSTDDKQSSLDLFFKNNQDFDKSVKCNENEKLINGTNVMKTIRVESSNKSVKEIKKECLNQSTTQTSVNNIEKMKPLIEGNNKIATYLFDNPIIKVAQEREGLLDKDEFREMMQKFLRLPLEGRLLFGKMYERIPEWYRVEDDLVKKYSESFGDVKGLIAMLIENGLLKDDLSTDTLFSLLNLLNIKEMKNVCKYFKLKTTNGSKEIMTKELLIHSSQKNLLGGNLANKVKSIVVKELGQCVRLNDEFKEMFNLLVVLATYPYHRDEEKKRLSNLVLRLNQLNRRIKTLPSYICKPEIAFRNFQHLTEYVEALNFVANYSNLVEKKDWEAASKIVIDAKSKFSGFLCKLHSREILQNIGGHLVRFTAGYQYAYCLNDGISVLKKDSKYADDCIDILTILLSQKDYLVRKRGLWYEEMALIYQKRKDLLAAYNCVKYGLKDDTVDLIKRRMLSQRASTLIKRKTTEITDGMRCQLHELIIPDNFQPETHTITAKYHEGVAGRKQVFYRESHDDDTVTEYCSVEEIVIDYYKNNSSPTYQKGMHDEGRTLMNLILACFFDIIYWDTDGDSMFHSDLQTHPLDWGGRHFFYRRKSLIQEHLEELRKGGLGTIMEFLHRICENFEDTDSAINWSYLTSEKLSNIKELLECLGSDVFLKIAEHVISDFKLYHSGFPDLIMWDPPTKKCLLVEVKGPNDKLSPSQTVWLENLRKFGANALVCHVERAGSRRRK